MKTLIVTALRKEFSALTEFLASEGLEMERIEDKAVSARFPEYALLVATAGHGKAQFATATQYLIDSHGPFDLVIATGAAGALDANLFPGDVVIATEIVEHDYKLRFDGYTPAPRHPCSVATGQTIMQSNQKSRSFRIYMGPIASGDEDVVDAERATELCEQTEALCVAWEGAGGAKAARFNSIPFIEIGAVTDAADGEAANSFQQHLTTAVKNIGQVLLEWLRGR